MQKKEIRENQLISNINLTGSLLLMFAIVTLIFIYAGRAESQEVYSVKGQVINSGVKKIEYAIIKVNFLDKNGTLLYSGPVNINDIKPGEKKTLKSVIMGL